ncbi:MAG: glycolate oxidase subunit GlcF, partial [Methylothermaceae bacterium]|nr:glycolate oxidase subunit GlcF [Methylothermaceae bacterium]
MTASGCGVTVKEYGELLAHDPDYAAKAATVSALAKDLSEVMAEKAGLEALQPKPVKVAFQSPCTLQHGLGLAGKVESLLRYLGFELTPVADPHLCCGSAGTYSILQPKLARRLRRNKIAALERGDPDVIATANIGCLLHLRPAASRPVVHWIELLDQGSGAGRVKT